MQKNLRISHNYFLIGLGLISLLAYTLLLCAFGLIRGYPISFWQFPAAVVLMGITQFFASKYVFGKTATAPFFRSVGILAGIAVVSIIFARTIYDSSFNGQRYQQELVNQLKTGFNPYLRTMPVPEEEMVSAPADSCCSATVQSPNEAGPAAVPPADPLYLNINHSPKGIAIVEAAIYRFTDRIETGKAVNLMVLVASFCLGLSLLYKLNRFSAAKKWLITALAVFNPVSIAQLSTYATDGILYSVMLCLFLLFCFCLTEINKYYLYLLGLLIMISVNIKFISLLYAGIFFAGFLLILIFQKNWLLCKRIFYAG
ncbi:MAG TPA: hypothetical protein VGM24_02530, partial [Puia sp.]